MSISEELIRISKFKPILIHPETPCSCGTICPENFVEFQEVFQNMNKTFTCTRTNTLNRGIYIQSLFGHQFSESETDDSWNDPITTAIQRLFTGCQLKISEPIPDGGDCGFIAMCLCLRYDLDHINILNHIRHHCKLSHFYKFEENSSNDEKKKYISSFNWVTMLRYLMVSTNDLDCEELNQGMKGTDMMFNLAHRYTFNDNGKPITIPFVKKKGGGKRKNTILLFQGNR